MDFSQSIITLALPKFEFHNKISDMEVRTDSVFVKHGIYVHKIILPRVLWCTSPKLCSICFLFFSDYIR